MLADHGLLTEALEALLEGPLDAQPVLLIVDDLETILETPTPSQTRTPVQAPYRAALSAILSAFGLARTDSRLLLTNRYRFTLADGSGRVLAEGLTSVPLRPMDGVERRKQLWAACVFAVDLPIPHPALEAAGAAGGVADPAAALERLLGLGLADDWGRLDGIAQAAANPLARPLAQENDAGQRALLAAAALPPLAAAWQGPDGSFARDARRKNRGHARGGNQSLCHPPRATA